VTRGTPDDRPGFQRHETVPTLSNSTTKTWYPGAAAQRIRRKSILDDSLRRRRRCVGEPLERGGTYAASRTGGAVGWKEAAGCASHRAIAVEPQVILMAEQCSAWTRSFELATRTSIGL